VKVVLDTNVFVSGVLCIYSRTKGDHLVYHFPGAIRPVVIPKYKEVPAFVIMNNMRVLGMSREKYFELLSKI
jgi:hypothetical protein